MIVHIMSGERYHLVPRMANGFVTTFASDAQQRIILLGSNKIDKTRYDHIFEGIGYTDYSFCTSKKDFVKYIWKNRNHAIIKHGEDYLYLFLLFSYLFRCPSINWICWGSAAKISKGGISVFFNPIKIFLYNRLHSIITLMENDKQSIINDYKYPAEKIQTLSYAGEGAFSVKDQICEKIRNEKKSMSGKIKVLVGNNPGNIPYYIQIIDLLSSFKGRIELHCMMNYSVVKNQLYNDFITHGKTIFGKDFYSDEDFHSYPEPYSRYMNSYDIYLCGNPNQTGLGALYTMLQLGKKIYVTGKNYSWLKEGIGSIIYDISTIKDFDEFAKPLSKEEKDYNYSQFINFKKLAPEQWHKYLREVDKK